MTNSDVSKIRILAVDDEEKILDMYRDILEPNENEKPFSGLASQASELFGNTVPEENGNNAQFEVVTCSQGDEALQQVGKSLEEDNPFAVAFIDVRMPPGPSGDVVAKKIHAIDPCMNIVIVTAYSDVTPQEILNDFQIPARLFYVQKPFHWNEIYQFAVALSNNWEINRQLKEQYNEMEVQLLDQSSELLHAQKKEHDEMAVTKNFQEELDLKTKQVEEVNTALRVLLREKERDKAKTEESIAFNINEYVTPYLAKLRESGLSEHQEKLVTIIENNLLDVTSAFSAQQAPKRLNFSPMELQVAKLIKHGRTSKEIAETLSLSALTVESYRRNIRKKIGLTHSKENLRTWLMENI